MIATPAYDPQTRSEQRRTIARGGAAFVWTLALEFNANAHGIRERLVTLMEWPYTGHIPYVPVTGMTEPLLILLQMEIAANLPSVRVTITRSPVFSATCRSFDSISSVPAQCST